MAHNIQDGNANNHINQERFKELKKLIGEQEGRIQNLQTSAFQLANYYFVFQGVVLAAISNTTSLTCSDSWFIFTLSLLPATLNLFALFSVGSKYVRAMDLHDQTWSEYNFTVRMLSSRNQTAAESLDFTGVFSPGNNYHGHEQRNNAGRQWRDHFSRGKRYVVLSACMILFLAFTGVTLSGPWRVTCKHDKNRKHPCGNMDCLKFCNGSRCMILCQDSY